MGRSDIGFAARCRADGKVRHIDVDGVRGCLSSVHSIRSAVPGVLLQGGDTNGIGKL